MSRRAGGYIRARIEGGRTNRRASERSGHPGKLIRREKGGAPHMRGV